MTVTDAVVLPAARHLELVATEVAAIAATHVAQSRHTASAIAAKSSPTDVVTATDLESESLIRRELRQRCPGSTIVGEEYDEAAGTNKTRWIVDPIDGTVNFLYGLPIVSVSIAAAIDERTVAGAVVDIASGAIYSAHVGGGARLDGAELSTSQPADLASALIGTGFSYHSPVRAEQAAVLTELLPACRDIRCMGSAALNLCWVAAGHLDGYFERTIKPYDYAAGALIAAEAGAVVELPSADSDLTWAASPAIADELADIVRPASA